MTLVSTNHMILYNGGRPVINNIEPETLNIDPICWSAGCRLVLGRSSSSATGPPCDMDAIHTLAREYRVPVLEGAAHTWEMPSVARICLETPFRSWSPAEQLDTIDCDIDVAIERGVTCGLRFCPETDPAT